MYLFVLLLLFCDCGATCISEVSLQNHTKSILLLLSQVTGGITGNRMMLNADMALIIDVSNMTSEGEVIGCVYDTCDPAPGDTRDWAYIYANDNEYFLEQFGYAFTKMINHGYDTSELSDLS